MQREHWHVDRQGVEGVKGAGVRGDDDDAFHALCDEVLDGRDDRFVVSRVGEGRTHPVPGRTGRTLDCGDAARRAVLQRIGREHAERTRAPGAERSRCVVHPVVELVHRLQHARLGLRGDIRVIVQHTRDGLPGDSGERRDITDADSTPPTHRAARLAHADECTACTADGCSATSAGVGDYIVVIHAISAAATRLAA
jgi:hypothetical protein